MSPPARPSAPPAEVLQQGRAQLTALARTGWTATASATASGTAAQNAIDTSTTNRWGTPANQLLNQWFKVNMQAQRTFTGVTLDTTPRPTEYPRTFKVEVSNNDSTWTTVVASATGSSALVTVAFPSQTAQYIRVTVTAGASSPWSIYQFNVYDTTLSRASWTAVASSTSAGTNAQNALDGLTTSRWTTAGAQTNQSIEIDMKARQTFNQITLDAGSTTSANFPRALSVYASNDNMNWGTAVATGTGTARFVVVNFPFQQTRYIKITQTQTQTTPWSIEELNVNGQPTTQTTLPRGTGTTWVATASSTNGTNGAQNALDGSATTRWTSNTPQTNVWFQVDMGTPRTFNRITLDAGTTTNNFPRAYQVEVSIDPATWTIVATGTGTTALVTINFAETTARHIRITQTASNNTPWSIQEMNVSGSALSRVAWSPSASSMGMTDVAANAFDGNATTRWSTSVAQANGQTFQFDMGAAQVFNQLTLDAGTSTGNYPRGYSVQVSNDGTTWGSAVATGTGTTQLVTINFLTQTARFVRITQTGTAVTNFWSIHELNVWRIAQPCDTTTCTASDTCHTAGTCAPSTGLCSNPTKAVGATCDDGNACTQVDTCNASFQCVGGGAVTCPQPNQCQTAGGACVPGMGCSPLADKPYGTACDDGDACTASDFCVAGQCQSPMTACTPVPTISFHHSFSQNTMADIGRSANTPSSIVPFVPAQGIFGPGINGATSYDSPFATVGNVSPNNFALSKPGSVSLWFKPEAQFSDTSLFFAWDNFSGLLFSINTGPSGISAYFSDGQQTLLYGTVPWAADLAWHLVVVNWSRTGFAISVDGNEPTLFSDPTLANRFTGGGAAAFASSRGSAVTTVNSTATVGPATGPSNVVGTPIPPNLSAVWNTILAGLSAGGFNGSAGGAPAPKGPGGAGPAAPDSASLNALGAGSGSLVYAGGGIGPNPATHSKDELLILSRPMTVGEIQWYWQQRTAPQSGPNPAIAFFNASTTTCDVADDLDLCTTDSCDPATGVHHALVNDPACEACHTQPACPPGGTCPDPVLKANWTPCADTNVCNGLETCQSGKCALEIAGGATTCADGPRVTFYQSFDSGTTVDMAAGGRSPTTGEQLVQVPGLFGMAEDASTYPWLGYPTVGNRSPTNIVLSKPGSVSMWLKPDGQYTHATLFIAFDNNAGLQLMVTAGTTAVTAQFTGHVQTSAAWIPDNRWHLIVINWSRTSLAVSVDGSFPAVASAPTLATLPFAIDPSNLGNAIYPMAGSTGYAKDELLVLNRPLSLEEIQWYYGQRLTPVLPNPAVALFNTGPTNCVAADDLNPCTTDLCSSTSGFTHSNQTGTSCSDGFACTQVDLCQQGSCVSGAPVGSDDLNPCTADICNPALGGDTHPPTNEGMVCTDGNANTSDDSCHLGTCWGPAPPSSGTPIFAQFTDLGVIDGARGSRAMGLNNNGDVAGAESTVSAPTNSTAWRYTASTGSLTAIPVAAGDSAFTGWQANAINGNRVVVGDTGPNGEGFMAAPGQPAQIITGRHGGGTARAISEDGRIAASDRVYVSGVDAGYVSAFRRDADASTHYVGQLLGTTAGGGTLNGWTAALDIGPTAGELVGYAQMAETNRVFDSGFNFAPPGGVREAYVFRDPYTGPANRVNLNDYAAANGWQVLHTATATNGTHVVGWGVKGNLCRAFKYTLATNTVVDLGDLDDTHPGADSCGAGTPGQFNYYNPTDINIGGDVVGSMSSGGAFYFRSSSGEMIDLQHLIAPALQVTLDSATGISNAGEIVGSCHVAGDLKSHAFKLRLPAAVNPQNLAAGIVPHLEGIATDSLGQTKAIFSYHNAATTNVHVPYGTDNSLVDGQGFVAAPAELPPQWFAPGTSSPASAFVTTLTGSSLTWTVGGNSDTAFASMTPMDTSISTTGRMSAVLPDGSLVALEPDIESQLAGTIVHTSVEATGSAVGRIDGAFDVTDDGAASYRLPLWVPDGVAGVQPDLALAYNSRGGDGFLGVGWSLEGMSTISRCRWDFARDGETAPLLFDVTDKLCLGSDRLVLVSGNYNRTGSEYRTEDDRFIKIVQVGEDQDGPTGFLAYLPNGERQSYGFAASAQVAGYLGHASAVLQGNRPRVTASNDTKDDPTVIYNLPARLSWALASSRDRYDNTVTYTYVTTAQTEQNHYTIDFRPSTINYTSRLSQAGDRSVTFVYNDPAAQDVRVDFRDSYVRGLPLRIGHMLREIRMRGPNPVSVGLLKAYKLAYRNELSGRTLLTGVTECDRQDVCKPATSFEWTSVPANDFVRVSTGISGQPVSGGVTVRAPHALVPADVNGDGMDDLVYSEAAETDQHSAPRSIRTLVYLSTGSYAGGSSGPVGFSGPTETGHSSPEIPSGFVGAVRTLRAADLDMDGRVDVIPQFGKYGFWHQLVRSHPAPPRFVAFVPFETSPDYERTGLDMYNQPLYVGDFSGDGLPDIMRVFGGTVSGPGHWAIRINSSLTGLGAYKLFGPEFPFAGSGSPTIPIIDDWNAYVVDVDGDNKDELLYRKSPPTFIDPRMPVGTRMFALDSRTSLPRMTSLLGSGTGQWDKTDVRYQMADLNGDGLQDAVEIPVYGGHDIRVSINSGLDFLPPVSLALLSGVRFDAAVGATDGQFWSAIDRGIRSFDYDLDGRTDILVGSDGCTSAPAEADQCDNTPFMAHPVVLMPRGTGINGFTHTTSTSGFWSSVPVSDPSEGGFKYREAVTNRHICCLARGTSPQILDANGDGLADFLQSENGTWALYLRRGPKPNLLKKITDGMGHVIQVAYKPITDSSVYKQTGSCTYPQYCGKKGTYVVSNHELDPGQGSGGLERAYSHVYDTARHDMTGMGWLGMDEHIETDLRTNSVVRTKYDHTTRVGGAHLYPFRRRPYFREEATPLALSGQANTKAWTTLYDVVTTGAKIAVSPRSVTHVETDTSLSGVSAVKRTWTLTTSYDPTYGYLTSRLMTVGEPGRQETERLTPQYYPDQAATWLVGMLDRETVTSTTPALTDPVVPSESATRVTKYVRDLSKGTVTGVIIEPDSQDPNIHLETSYGLTPAGQVRTTTVRQLDGTVRESTVEYDPTSGIYPYRVRNPMVRWSTMVVHPGLGVLAESIDDNGLVITRRYDGFGRPTFEQRSDETPSTLRYRSEPGYPLVVDSESGGGLRTVKHDFRGQERYIMSRTANGTFSHVRIDYDPYGRVTKQWRPAASTISSDSLLPSTTIFYDELGRVREEYPPVGRTAWLYELNKTRRFVFTSDIASQEDDSIIDHSGRLVKRIEQVRASATSAPHDVTTRYAYGPFGVLRDIVDTGNNVTHMEYDVRGRTREVRDPDTGTQVNVHNAVDELVRETYANGHFAKLHYDPLGRLDTETTTEGISVYIWDSAPNGIGQIGTTSSQDGVTVDYEYNPRKRQSAQIWTVDGTVSRLDMGYDAFGRPRTTTYPQVGSSRYQTTTNYSPQSGELQSIVDGSQALLWRVDARNPEGSILTETFGDGVITSRGYEAERGLLTSITTAAGGAGVPIQALTYRYETRGYLDRRQDASGQQPEGPNVENFDHDALGRLKKWYGDGGNWAVDFDYDDLGNMLTRHQVVGGATQELRTFVPAGTSRPHGLMSMTVNGTPSSYHYDLAGRQDIRPNATVVYTDFDLPRTITSGGGTWRFKYDANHARTVKQSAAGTTVYAGGLYERRTTAGGVVTDVMYVPGEGGVVAQVTRIAGGSPTIEYIHGDHLGSVDTVASGGSAARMKFDPFGGRIAPASVPTSPMTVMGSPVPSITKGFTGHEQDDDVGLINMNGRIYDPMSARFLTADPLVSRPWKSQSLNSYCYVENSPLAFGDPSGFAPSVIGTTYYPGHGGPAAQGAGGPSVTRIDVSEREAGRIAGGKSSSTSSKSSAGTSAGKLDDNGGGRSMGAAGEGAAAVAQGPSDAGEGSYWGGEGHSRAGAGATGPRPGYGTPRGGTGAAAGSGAGPKGASSATAGGAGALGPFAPPGGYWGQGANINLGTGFNPYAQMSWAEGSVIVADIVLSMVGSGVGRAARAALPLIKRLFGRGAASAFGAKTLGAAQVKILQTGGHKITRATARELNKQAGTALGPREWGRALEGLKDANSLPPNFHGKITATGDYLDKAGNFIGSILEYLP